MKNLTIREWAQEDRPREKLMSKGVRALSNAELLAILINNGTQNESAVQVTQKLLQSVGNSLKAIGTMSVAQILNLKTKGIGPAKAITIVAALELGLRRESDMHKKEFAHCGQDAAHYLRPQFQYYTYEVFAILFLNLSNRIEHFEIVSVGGTSAAIVDIKIILKKALEWNASKLILCHNHPSGNLKPSQADLSITDKITEGARLMDIAVIDHIIVSDQGYFSFAEEGLL